MNVRGALRLFVATTIAVIASLGAAPANAIQVSREGRQEGAQSRVRVEPNGLAAVDFQLRYRVLHAPLHSLDMIGIGDEAEVDSHVNVSADDGREVTARAERMPHGGIRLEIEDSHGLSHGVYTFALHWRSDLQRSGALVRGDSTWTFAWSPPKSLDGFDSGRSIFEFPSAPDAPQPIVPTTGGADESAQALIRRSGMYDEVEIVTPHVSPGQALVSTLRLDARAFPVLADTPPPASPPSFTQDSDPVRGVVFGAILVLLALSLALALAKASRRISETCAARGVPVPTGLVPLATSVRAMFAGLSFAAGVGLQTREEYTSGAACVALATLCAAIRPPLGAPAPRGPGRWLPIGPDRAPAPDESAIAAWPNLRTRAGQLIAGAFGVFVAVGVLVAHGLEAPDPWLVALDAAPFVPLLVLGRGVCARPSDDRGSVRWVLHAFRRLHRGTETNTVLWARVAGALGAADEVRVLTLPRAPLPGLVGIELGLAWSATPGGWSGAPEVLVRVRAESPALEALGRALPRARTLPGRGTDERVARLIPRLPTRSCAIALVSAVAAHMTDRRAPRAGTWTAPERRRDAGPWASLSGSLRASSSSAGVAA